nr:cobyrinate a,c-diamide synthase [Humibacillus sp. DSM 29435]
MTRPEPSPATTATATATPTTRLPRLVVAAPASGHGKTTVATGLMAALRREGLAVGGFKVGPDFIDPGYHSLATGRPGRNLDPFLTDESLIEPLLLHGAQAHGPTDIAVIEGVMGLFDGRIGHDGFASTAHVATLTRSPIVLVLDVSHLSRTAAAIVHGLATFDPNVRLAGVILNKAASARHTGEVRAALESTGLPVLGVLPRDAGIEAPSRHLGLVPVEERVEAAATIDRMAERVAEHLDLAAIVTIAHSAPDLSRMPWSPTAALASACSGSRYSATAGGRGIPRPGRPVVAVAGGRSFTFRYAETEELLRAAGLEPVHFDPTTDGDLPPGTAGLYLGGGFPEVHATELSANHALRQAIRAAVNGGMPTVAECAGLLYLCRSVDGHEMVGALPATAAMGPRLTLGYRTAVATVDSLLGPAGQRVTGHEFHRTTITPDADKVAPGRGTTYESGHSTERFGHATYESGHSTGSVGAGTSPSVEWPLSYTRAGTAGHPGWLLDGRPDGLSLDPAGTGRATVHASYLHIHWAGHPQLAARFADAVHEFALAAPSTTSRTVAGLTQGAS